ncbi:MAG: IS1 family transposase [Chloroflexi bacterium]|nr:MAG: IS1 family transposase [Chloroflexota bacterium]
MKTCPHCHSTQSQVKAGHNPSGSQRYLCNNCDRTYTPTPNHRGYPVDVRYQAIELYQEGHSFRAVARELGVGTQSVINWVRTKEIMQKHKKTNDTQNGGNHG